MSEKMNIDDDEFSISDMDSLDDENIENFDVESSESEIDLYTTDKTGYPMMWLKLLLNNFKIDNNCIMLFDNIITGIEIIGYIHMLKNKFYLSVQKSSLKKEIKIKKKKDKMEIDENVDDIKSNQETVNNNIEKVNYENIEIIVFDDFIKDELTKVLKENIIISILGTLTICSDNKIAIKINHFKKFNFGDKKLIKKFIQIKTLFTKKYLLSTQDLPNPWWEANDDRSDTRKDVQLTFIEWIDANSVYNKYAGFISSLGITTWSEFKLWVVSGSEKYRAFVTLLKHKMNEDIIAKFITDTMKAMNEYA